jgi:predicted AAA+ superfamily ATPase
MIQREITSKILELREKYPVITLTGARQTGKTTLLKSLYTDIPYINLEDIDNRTLAENDPRGFLGNFPAGAVIDEAQQVPKLFSYIQQIVDSKDVRFVLSGSQNFQLLQNISQSLAGRTAILTLMPFSRNELSTGGFHFDTYEEIVFKGCYPRMYDKNIAPPDFYPYYINTYIERDVRQIKNIENLTAFTHFLQLCAGRIGQVVNLQSLANDSGISVNTVKAWLSLLEASYVTYLYKPHHKNFNKRLVKSPKLYFYDTGLACSLLQIQSAEQLQSHYLKGGLFENFVINEMTRYFLNKGIKPQLCFWQNKDKKEIDIILDKGTSLFPFEVKASKTRNHHLLENLSYWNKLNNTPPEHLNLIYGGEEDFKTSAGHFISWKNIRQTLDSLGM